MRMRFIQVVITSVALLMAISNTWFPEIKIDALTVVLLGISILPWLAPLFKSVEIPGAVKVEFQDLEKAREKVEKSGLIPSKKSLKPMQKHEYSFQTVSGNDPNLALSGLRIEIESRLKKIAERKGIKVKGYSVNRLTQLLEQSNILSHNEAAAIRDLLPLLNQAVHGAKVEGEAFDWAMDFGPQVLGAIEDLLGETTIPKTIEEWKQRDGAAFQEVGTKLSKAFIQAPEAFLTAMNQNPKELQDWLDGLENHTFTIYESQTELEDDLYLAYYEKLKAMMLDASKSCKESKFKVLSSKIEKALNNISIRRIH